MHQGSYVITLPKAWLRYFRLKPGDTLEIIANGELTIRPLGAQDNGQAKNNTTNQQAGG
jgi:AbrB family looped-hinge helix DNA binding protein